MRNRPELLRGTLPHPCGFPRSETFAQPLDNSRAGTFAQPSFPRRETFAQPSFPRRRTFAHPSFRRRRTFAQPSFPRRETFGTTVHSRAGRPLRNRHSHAGRPLHNRHSRAGPLRHLRCLAWQTESGFVHGEHLCDNRHSRAGRPLHNRHEGFPRRETFGQPSFPRRRESRFGGSPLGTAGHEPARSVTIALQLPVDGERSHLPICRRTSLGL